MNPARSHAQPLAALVCAAKGGDLNALVVLAALMATILLKALTQKPGAWPPCCF